MTNTSISHRPDENEDKSGSCIRREDRFSHFRPRSDRFENSERQPRRPGFLDDICQLDHDLIQLVARRTNLLARLTARPGVSNADTERELRLSWEKNATSISSDPRLIRQLFALLREIEINTDMEHMAYNLAPVQKPLNMDLPAPRGDRRIRMAITLAAGSGSPAEFSGVPLSNAVISCLKILNQLGGSLRWEEDGRILCRDTVPLAGISARKAAPILDKIIHAGEDIFNLYLLLFLMTTRPAKLKILGEGDLNLADLAPVRHFLPKLNARLTGTIPGREGLPAKLETSAMLPSEIDLASDLPADAVLALCLSTPAYADPVTIRAGDYPDAESIFAEAASILRCAGVDAEFTAKMLHVKPGRAVFAETPAMELHLPALATLLAMPAFVDGKATLRGADAESQRLAPVMAMLEQAGLQIRSENGSIQSTIRTKDQNLSLQNLPAEFFPIGLALSLIPLFRNQKKVLPALPASTDLTLVDDFLLLAGLVRDSAHGNIRLATRAEQETTSAWAAPDASWAMGFALAAFLHPHIKLVNPSAVSAQIPEFWTIYNTLPVPVLHAKEPERPQQPARPVRRRILATYMPESERPEPLPQDEDD